MEKNQKLLQNRELMLRNFGTLIENLDECEKYIDEIIKGNQISDPEICRSINKCLGQFTSEDLVILQQMIGTNFKDAVMANNLAKL